MRLKLEQETIILFNEKESTAEIYTFNKKWKRQLQKLAAQYPEDIILKKADDEGAVFYEVDKKLIFIRPPYGPERKEKLRQAALRNGSTPPELRNRDSNPVNQD